MSVVKVIGGLGNQMFQFSFAFAVKKNNQTQLQFDTSGFHSYRLRHFELHKFCTDGVVASVAEINRLKFKKEGYFSKIRRLVFREKRLSLIHI